MRKRPNLMHGLHRVTTKGKTYYYAWRGGPRLEAEPGTKAFLAEYLRLTKHQEPEPDTAKFAGLVADYRASPEWQKLRPKSQRLYDLTLTKLVEEYGELPLPLLETKGMRGDFLRFRDSLSARPATADLCMAVLRAVLSWAVKRELISVNKAAEIEKLNRETRRDRIWSEQECQTFIASATPMMVNALKFALLTGQRQGDLLKMTWKAYNGATISLKQQKTGGTVVMPCSPELKAMLDSMPRKAVTILTNHEGRPWTERAFQSAFTRAMKRAGITGLRFHDLRGTYISRAHALGYSIKEIAESSGHSEKNAEQMIRKHYLAATDVVSIRKTRND